ncbi:MAG TPA: ferredoxin--nitrite reductase [Verrucomicrobiae bacterium]|jgi:ferredoxin-nitrite reductase|nr:ferredoxin--nitrite reductase [Verrucomicrobiae bacterium]
MQPANPSAAVKPGASAAEMYKASKGGDGLRIREDLPRFVQEGWESLSKADKDLLKWVGVFFRNPTPGKFMMRIRMPNGFANSEQLRAIADVSRRLGNCLLDITTRQQIELRGFTIESVPEIWEKLRGVNLHTLQTGMDNVRNINGCALAGMEPSELLDASPVVFELDRAIVGADGNPEFTNLPRKFNIVITGCLGNCTHAESQDIALVPASKGGRIGFNMLVGGKMGSGGFTIASPLDVFIEPEHAAVTTRELVLIYRDHGPRDARARCRLSFLIEEWGLPRLRSELESRLGRELEPAGTDARSPAHSDHVGVTRQKQPGLAAVGLSVATGRLEPGEMEELAHLADHYGDGQVRLTINQNAILPNVPEASVERLMLEPLLRKFSPRPSPFMRGLVACTGTDFCNLAQIETKQLGAQLSQALEQRLGKEGAPVTMHWSGCTAGCGNHQAADIGFRGQKINVGGQLVDAVAIYVGGRTGRDAVAGEQILDAVPCDDSLVDVVAGLVANLRSGGREKHDGALIEAAPVELVSIEPLAADSRRHANGLEIQPPNPSSGAAAPRLPFEIGGA